ncbi:hypothetical protein SCUCBS95973_009141 [Sporothrix curviconia]|uniref:Major facilitator superfamily (MFS) profile domain-containing protein n=1 Tax=Sporothrix curviconia TaxID=1260050 RepID=A0ABP0CVJ4_9PEZI
MAARMLNYIYIGMELSVVPVYQTEVVVPEVRGFVVSCYQLSLILGQLVINSICNRTSSLKTAAAYRIPYGMFFIIPSLVLAGMWFVPESPVWLLARGRHEEARRNFEILRRGAYSEADIAKQFDQMRIGVEMTSEKQPFADIFRSINLKRTLVVVAFSSQYGAIWIKSLDTTSAFNVTIIMACTYLAVTVFSIAVVDKTLGLFVIATLSCIQPNTPQIQLGIVCSLVIGDSAASLGLSTLVYGISTEVPADRLCDSTVLVGFIAKVVTTSVVAFCVPYIIEPGYGNLSGKIGFIFGGMGVLCMLFIWYCVPECAGKSAEEIELLFQHKVPMRKFKNYDTSLLVTSAEADDQETQLKRRTVVNSQEVDV